MPFVQVRDIQLSYRVYGRQRHAADPPLLLIAGLFMLVTLLLNRISSALPRLTLPAALHWCWWRALPLALVGLVYLIFV